MFSTRVIAGIAVAAAIAAFGATQLIGGPVAPTAANAQDIAQASTVAERKMDFNRAAFDAAQAAGKPILIDIRADWCIVCARQKPIIEALATEPRFHELMIFEIDFDSQKDLVREFEAFRQATLIAFKGSEEVGRSIYDSQAHSIEALLDLTI